jgi:hypothetical protein
MHDPAKSGVFIVRIALSLKGQILAGVKDSCTGETSQVGFVSQAYNPFVAVASVGWVPTHHFFLNTNGGFHPPYSPNSPSGAIPDHSGSTMPRAKSRWIDEYGQSTARSTNPCFTGFPQQYRICTSKSA